MEVQYEDYIKENFNFSNLFMLLCYYRMDFGVRNKILGIKCGNGQKSKWLKTNEMYKKARIQVAFSLWQKRNLVFLLLLLELHPLFLINSPLQRIFFRSCKCFFSWYSIRSTISLRTVSNLCVFVNWQCIKRSL